jgi:hypothetical protein
MMEARRRKRRRRKEGRIERGAGEAEEERREGI